MFVQRKMISEERLAELRRILKEDYGKDLPPAEGADIGHRLVGFFGLLADFAIQDGAVASGEGKKRDGDSNLRK